MASAVLHGARIAGDTFSTARGKFSKNDKYSFKQAMLGTA